MNTDAYAGHFEGKTHILPVRIYYEDTDMSGIVYHANYLRYFERGRSDFLRLAGVGHTELQARDKPLAFAITKAEIEYKKAARIDDSLLVCTDYEKIEGIKIFINQRIMRGDILIATAKITVVFIDFKGNPQRPPKDIVDMLLPYFQ